MWPTLLATIHGFSAVEPRLYEVSSVLGLSRLEVIRKIALPSALPDILAGMRLSATVALILTVVGEMLTSRDGLGQWIILAAQSFQAAKCFRRRHPAGRARLPYRADIVIRGAAACWSGAMPRTEFISTTTKYGRINDEEQNCSRMAAAIIAAVIAHGPALGAPETPNVTIGMTSSSVFLNAFVAKDQGFFSQARA